MMMIILASRSLCVSTRRLHFFKFFTNFSSKYLLQNFEKILKKCIMSATWSSVRANKKETFGLYFLENSKFFRFPEI